MQAHLALDDLPVTVLLHLCHEPGRGLLAELRVEQLQGCAAVALVEVIPATPAQANCSLLDWPPSWVEGMGHRAIEHQPRKGDVQWWN